MKKFSLWWFSCGLIAGLVVGGGVVGSIGTYLLTHVISGQDPSGVFSGTVQDIHNRTVQQGKQEGATSVYGKISGLTDSMIVLQVVQADGQEKDFTFLFDGSTKFVQLAHDASSTQEAIDVSELATGQSVDISAQEAIGSVPNQYATEVVRY